MTFTELSAAGEYAGCTFDKTAHYKSGIKSTGTHNPDRPQVRRILISGNPGGICGCIAAPVA